MLKVTQQVGKQIGKLSEGVFEQAKKTPGEIAGAALEQLGVAGGHASGSGKRQKPAGPVDGKAKLEQMEKTDLVVSQRQVQKLEAEIQQWRRLREEQLRRRREQLEQTRAQAVVPQEAVSGALPAAGGKPKRGSLFLRRQKGKTEMAGMKRSG